MLILRVLNILGTALLSLIAIELVTVWLAGMLEPFSRAWLVLPAFLTVPLWMIILTLSFSSSQRWKWNTGMAVLSVISAILLLSPLS